MRFRLWSVFVPAAPPSPLSSEPPREPVPAALRILLVHPGPDAAELIAGLAEAGCAVTHERSGDGGFYRAATEPYDVLLIASDLSGRDGVQVLGALRRQGVTTPVLLMGHGITMHGRVTALDSGADDSVTLPVSSAELGARVRALARRAALDPVRLWACDVVLDPMARTASRAGRALRLTMREFQILEYLVRCHGQVVPRARLCRDVWQGHEWRLRHDNAIDVHMARLRKKLDGPGEIRLIHTVRGVGYAFGQDATDGKRAGRRRPASAP